MIVLRSGRAVEIRPAVRSMAPLLAAILVGLAGCGHGDHSPLTFAISFPTERSAQPLDGRVLLFISDDSTKEPRFQTDEYRANTTRPIFGIDVDSLEPGQAAVISDTVFGFPARSIEGHPAGDYWVQALFNRFETFHRSDGKTVKLPPDMGEGQHWATKPGNFYSKPAKVHIDPSSGTPITISMDQVNPPITPPAGHETGQVRQVPERPIDQVLGSPDVHGRDRPAPLWVGHTPQRPLPGPDPSRPLPQGHGERRLARDTAGRERHRAAARPPATRISVLQGLERPAFPADDPRAHPAPDAVFRRLVRGELCEQRPVRRCDHLRADPATSRSSIAASARAGRAS